MIIIIRDYQRKHSEILLIENFEATVKTTVKIQNALKYILAY